MVDNYSQTISWGHSRAVEYISSQDLLLPEHDLQKIKPDKLPAWEVEKGSWCPTPNWEASDDWWTGESLFSLGKQPLRGHPCSSRLIIIHAERNKKTQWIYKKPKACVWKWEKQWEEGGRHWRARNGEDLIKAQMHGLGFSSNIHKEIVTPYALEWREGV